MSNPKLGQFELEFYAVRPYKVQDGDMMYSVHWYDTGANSMGFTTRKEAQLNSDAIIRKQEARKGVYYV